MGDDIFIFYDDLIDSDNWATALFILRAALKNPSIRVIWIVEPRQVAFGLSMTGAQIAGCQELLKKYFPAYPNTFKTLLGGLLKQSDLDGLKGLTRVDRDLVSTTPL
jgi:hypothetical protein